MKYNKLAVIVFMILCMITLKAISTGQSGLYGSSYMMRVQGAEALYWNPALLSPAYNDIIIPGVNQALAVANNAFDLETYDMINGHYLDDNDKEHLLDQVQNQLVVIGEGTSTIFGISFSNMAFATSVHFQAKASVSEKYLKLLLYGNEEDDYVFTKRQNQVSAIAYQDFSLGMGNIRINDALHLTAIPDIYLGATGSLLAGYGILSTKSYYGAFQSGLDGMFLQHEAKLGTGTGGVGVKSMLGLASEPIPYLKVGMTLDNLFGNIRWFAKTEDLAYSIEADSVFAADLEDDFYTQQDSTIKVSSFNTQLPPEFRLGAVYDFGPATLSADWVQGFKDSQVTSSIGRVSLAGEFLPMPYLPLSFGVSFGNSDYPWRVSYGIGLRTKGIRAGIGFQTIKAVDLLGSNSKGIAISTYLSLPY